MALHCKDFEHDLYRNVTSGVEDMFRALVGWPGEDDVPNTTGDERRGMLLVCCEYMIDHENARQMPRGTFDLILNEAEELDGGTYADGARAVLRCPTFFANLDREGR